MDADPGAAGHESGAPMELSGDMQMPNPGLVLSREEEREVFRELLASEPALAAGQTWYLIDYDWYRKWEDYLEEGSTMERPDAISNDALLADDEGAVRRLAMEHTDYVIRSDEVWLKLRELYGGGPEIARSVVVGHWGHKSVEIHPLKLKFLRSTNMDEHVVGLFSKGAKVRAVKAAMCERMGLSPDDVRIWDYHQDQKLKILTDDLSTLSEERILDSQKLLFEERLPNGKWPKLATKRDLRFAANSASVPPGVCGLSNLGNTCFMNSGLQCLSNTFPLSRAFVSGDYEEMINSDNPLGTKGELATEFGDLLQGMWSGRCSSMAPRDFKWKLERFAPQFAGWQQHDSHELLAFLLDGLHEDLNRVGKKPYFESNEFDLPEVEAAAKSWEQHLARNNSIITDWFHGQLRSELDCPECPRISKTFDPLMYLSVPLPQKTTRFLKVVVWTQDYSQPPTRYGLTVPKHGTITDLKRAVAAASGTNPASLSVCDVYNHRFFKRFKNREVLSQIQSRDTIWVFERHMVKKDKAKPPSVVAASYSIGPEPMDVDDTGKGEEGEDAEDAEGAAGGGAEAAQDDGEPPLVNVTVTWREEKTITTNSRYYGSHTQLYKTPIDPPLIVALPSRSTYGEMYHLLRDKLGRFFRPPGTQTSSDEEEDDRFSDDSHDAEGEAEGAGGGEGDAEEEKDAAAATTEPGAGGDQQVAPAPMPSDKRFFVVAKGDRYAQVPSYEKEDDEPLLLDEGDNLVLRLVEESDTHYGGVFDHRAADSVMEDDSCNPVASKDTDAITLDKCLRLYSEREQLGEDDPWYCNQCGEHRQAFKKFDLWKLPRVLVVHLKRFSYRNRHFREKINSVVHFPLRDLDLTEFVKGPIAPGEPPIYDLYAVSNHYGALGGGHYTAFAKNHNNGKWYKFDDSHVAEVHGGEESVITSAAYVLFYIRQDCRADGEAMPVPPGLPMEQDLASESTEADDQSDSVDYYSDGALSTVPVYSAADADDEVD